VGEVTAADLERVQAVKALGPLLGIQAPAPLMGPGASIVNVGSVAALQGPLSVRVNIVYPGFTDTPMTASASPAFRGPGIPESPLRRAGPPPEAATVIASC
jgi:3alpha(or 20beta)-hydroxysteroid dehydrogenase